MRCFALCLVLFLAGAFSAIAQTPPGEAEAAQYVGLHAAAWRGDRAEIRRLVASGTQVDTRDANGRTAFLIAAFRSHGAAMRDLVAAGADPRAKDRQNYDAITILAVKDDPETMSVAIEIGGDAKAITSPYLGTALIAAAHLGHDEIVRRLIRAGAPLDHVNNLGWTALIEAVILGRGGPRHAACVKALVGAGARRDLADREGVTPLDHARRRDYADIVRILEAGR